MRPMQVVFRQQAIDDLAAIAAYISRESPAGADKVIQKIHRTIFKTLANFPSGGRLDRATGAREFPVAGLPYLVIFLASEDLLYIVAVFHTSREPASKPRP